MRRVLPLAAAALWAGIGPWSLAGAPDGGAGSEWRHWGGTPGGVRFSPLRQVDRANVGRLAPAWTYRTGELAQGLAHSTFRAGFSTTPLAIDGRRAPTRTR